MTGPATDPRPLRQLIDEWLADATGPPVEPLRLERHLDGDDTPLWATWEVLDRHGRIVGLVAEEHEWLGDRPGPATYTAVENPGAQPWGARWRSEGHTTVHQALEALSDRQALGCYPEPPDAA